MYRIDTVLGKGTYGKVYGVSNLLTRRELALKRILIDPKVRGDFTLSLREMDMMTRLAHPHVIPLTEVLYTPPPASPLTSMLDDRVSFVMPRADMTIDKYVEQSPSIVHRKNLVWQLLVGLQYIHREGVIHRDLKPQNLLLFGKHLCIGDFGLATPYVQGEPRTPQMVTIWYRSPEILLNQDYDMKADIWSCGCILFELMSGRPLFAEDNELSMLDSIYSLLPSNTKYKFKHLKRKKRPYVSGYELSGVEAILHRELGLSERRLQEFGESSYRQFLTLLSKMLTLNPTRRPSCTSLLKDVYFDPYREELVRVSRPLTTPHILIFHPAREIGIGIIDQQRYPIQYRVKFLAVDILDRILQVKPEIAEDDGLVRKYSVCALYIAEKYLMEERCCSFEELISTHEEDFEGYEALEREVLELILEYRIYRKTLYDYLPHDVIPREISRVYLLFRKALPFTGMRLDTLYVIYDYVVDHYYEPVKEWGERISIECDFRPVCER